MPTFKPFRNEFAPRGYIIAQVQQADDDLQTMGQLSREAITALQELKAIAAKVTDTNPDIAQEMTAHIKTAEDRIALAFQLARHVIPLLGSLAEPEARREGDRQKGGDNKKGTSQHKYDRWQQRANEIWAKNPRLGKYAVAKIIAKEEANPKLEDQCSIDTIRRHIKNPYKS